MEGRATTVISIVSAVYAMHVSLKPAAPVDAPALAEVHVASWHEAYRGIVPESYLQRFTVESRTERFRKSLEDGSEETYVAQSNDQVVGFLTLGECRDTDVDRRTTGEIWGIYLSPEHWREGIGRFLSEQAEAMLFSRGCSVVKLWVLEANGRARRFYEEMGYEVDGVTRQEKIGVQLTAVRYSKKLKNVTAVSVVALACFTLSIVWSVTETLLEALAG